MKRTEFIGQVERCAQSLRDAGFTVSIHHGLPYVAVDFNGEETPYFAQGEEASSLLDEVPEDIHEEDWILFILDSAGALECVDA